MLQVRAGVFDAPARREAAGLRLLRPGALDACDEEAWHALGDDAEAASVFAEPWFMQRSLAHCDRRHRARLAVIADGGGRWLGVLPILAVTRQGRSPVPAWSAWRHPNQFVGTPLVRRGQADRFWDNLIRGLARRGLGVSLVLADLPSDEPVTQALFRVCAARDRAVVIDRRIARACLSPHPAPDHSAKQRSRIRGLERKLAAEVGPVAFELVRDADTIAHLLDTFLVLERSGWKGRAGSALACADGTQTFFREICTAAAARKRLELAMLSAGGRIVALSTQLEGAGRLYGFKAAYDEAFARYAPGLLLLDQLTRWYVERGCTVDSCAVPDQQPVSRLWPERRELIDCRVALGGPARARLFKGMLACERAARALRMDA